MENPSFSEHPVCVATCLDYMPVYMPVYVPVHMPAEDYNDGTESLRLFMSVYYKNADRSPINRRQIAGRSLSLIHI